MSDLPLDPEDFALRARVKLLGKLLGQVIAEHARPGVFEVVEELRTGFIALRGGDVEHAEPLDTMIRALDAETMMQVVRAFTIYFQLVNVADELYQHRARRRQVAQGGRLWVGSFDDSLASAVDAGLDAVAVSGLLGQMRYNPVFTAHPTEAKAAPSW